MVQFKYDPARGRFRHFFKAIVRNQAFKLYHKRHEHVSIDEISEPASDKSFDASWEEEWRRHVFTQAMLELRNQVQSNTFAAFEMYALQGRPVKEVADFLNLSVNSVYVAKNRCIEALKAIMENLETK